MVFFFGDFALYLLYTDTYLHIVQDLYSFCFNMYDFPQHYLFLIMEHIMYVLDQDPCSNTPCGHGTCYPTSTGGYTCSCQKGYSGNNCGKDMK